MKPLFDTLLALTEAAHRATPVLSEFVAWPEDVGWVEKPANPIPAGRLMAGDTGLASDRHEDWRDAWQAVSAHAHWRETWKTSGLGKAFIDRFACFELVGANGHYGSEQTRLFVVYMPAHVHYPWHEHPAEEMYYVIAGSGEFAVAGEPSHVRGPGQATFHPSGRPHALTTHDQPVMAYVLWRGDLATGPALTPPA